MVRRNPNRTYYFYNEWEPVAHDDSDGCSTSLGRCGVEPPGHGVHCTRPKGHKGPHEAGISTTTSSWGRQLCVGRWPTGIKRSDFDALPKGRGQDYGKPK